MGYTTTAIQGFGWHSALKFSGYALTGLKIVILARLLSPSDFGLFSLTAVVLGITEAVTETGINITLIQTKKNLEYYLDTAWVIAIIRGFMIAGLMLLLGWWMQGIFNQPSLFGLVAVASLVPIIKGFINPAVVSYHKELVFSKDSIYRFSLIAAEVMFSVALAWIWRDVLSLVVSLVLAGIFEVIVSFYLFKLRPRLRFSAHRARLIFHNAKWLSLSSVMSYLNDNLDNFLIGRFMGTYNLGLYQNAYALSHKPNYEITRSVHHSTLPVYAKLVDESDRLRQAFKKTFGANFLLSLTLSLPLLLFPGFFVSLILGSQWTMAIPLIRWLVLAGLLHSVSLVSYTLFLTKRAMMWMNVHQLLTLGLMVGAVSMFVSVGELEGAAVAMFFARLIALPFLLLGLKDVLTHAKKS